MGSVGGRRAPDKDITGAALQERSQTQERALKGPALAPLRVAAGSFTKPFQNAYIHGRGAFRVAGRPPIGASEPAA